ncbi:MAG TPA: PQQ-binding-like beta-propeller repeat protein [Gammaproteobacteria bacterium]|nr:PQQ-binding-like beta-propeller repeat protein [Gammaproteobacteria bacterium]
MRINTKWFRKYQGMLRVPLFEHALSNHGYIIVFDEKKRTYSLVKFDTQYGSSLWTTVLPNGGYGAPAYGVDLIIVPTGFSKVTAISIHTGAIVWSFETNSRIRGSIQFDGTCFCISSGSGLYFVSPSGELNYRIGVKGYFFFGEPLIIEDRIYSLVTFHKHDNSQLSILCFSRSGELLYNKELGQGVIASSDTSGITVLSNKNLAVGGDRKIFYLDGFSGEVLWEAYVPGYACRHKLAADAQQVYVTTLSGYVGAFCIKSGKEIWKSHYEISPTTPIVIIGSAAVFVADGYLNFLSCATGRLIERKAVGHSPYSIPTFHNGHLFLGAGEPPYEGLLWCFKIEMGYLENNKAFIIRAEEINCYDDANSFDLNLIITGKKLKLVEGDFSVISETRQANAEQLSPECFSFHNIPIKSNASAGIYIVPLRIYSDNQSYFDAIIIELRRRKKLPSFKLICNVQLTPQESVNLSGAAVVQAIYRYYGGNPPSQKAIREMVDFVKEKGNYEAFNIWRIILRRVLNSSAKSVRELPEYGC